MSHSGHEHELVALRYRPTSRISRPEYMKFQFYKTMKNSFPESLHHIILSHQQCMGDLVDPHSRIHLVLSNNNIN